MNKLYTRPIHQRKETNYRVSIYWTSLGTERKAFKQIRKQYKACRRLLLLSPYQSRTYTFGVMVENSIILIRKQAEDHG